jgi:hypothetical protein
MTNLTRFLASLISAALILVSPGQAWAAAVGRAVRVNTGGINAGNVHIKLNASGLNSLPLNTLNASPLKLGPSLQVSPGLQVNGQPVVERGALAEEATVGAFLGEKIAVLAEQAAPLIESFNNSNPADASSSHQSGQRLETVLTGGKMKLEGVFTGGTFEGLGDGVGGNFLAKPAGQEIQTSINSQNGDGNNNNPPPSGGGGDGNNGNDGGDKTPVTAKILAMIIAVSPAALMIWPLITAGAFVHAGLLLAGSAALASMVLLSERSSVTLRSLPGLAIGALGLASLATLLGGFSALTLSLGALITLAGWGFTRFAKKELKDRSLDSGEVIAAFFGALAAITGAGIIFLSPAGWVATAFTVLSFGSGVLLMHLPGWVGRGISAAAKNAGPTADGSYSVLGSLYRDSSLFKRLAKFSDTAIDEKPWNAIWVGLLWLPVIAVEALQWALIGVLSATLTLAQAPLMFLAGATESTYFNGVAKTTFAWAQGSKTGWFNSFEANFLPTINEGGMIARLLAAGVVRLGQWMWFAYALLAGTVGQLAALFTPTIGERQLPADPLAGKAPEIPDYKMTGTRLGKFLATAIGLTPLYFFGGALLTGGPLGWLVLGSVGLTALMPLTPWGGRIASALVTIAGGWITFESVRFLALAGLPTYWMIAAGVVAFLSGFGLANLIRKLKDPKANKYNVNEPEYILGYAGAVGVGLTLMVALAGLTTPLGQGLMLGGFALSLAVLAHLPAWLWRGLWGLIAGTFKPMNPVTEVSEKLWTESKAYEAAGDFYKARFKDAHWTTAVVLGIIFAVPAAVTHLILPVIQWALGLSLGLVVGAVRAPINYMVWAMDNGWSERYYQRLREIQEKAPFEGGFWAAVWWMTKLAALTAVSPLVWAYAALTISSAGGGHSDIAQFHNPAPSAPATMSIGEKTVAAVAGLMMLVSFGAPYLAAFAPLGTPLALAMVFNILSALLPRARSLKIATAASLWIAALVLGAASYVAFVPMHSVSHGLFYAALSLISALGGMSFKRASERFPVRAFVGALALTTALLIISIFQSALLSSLSIVVALPAVLSMIAQGLGKRPHNPVK